AEAPVFGDEAVLERNLRGGVAAAAHLRQPGPADEALVALLDQECGDAAGAAARLDGGEDDAEVGDVAVADERLAPVEDVAAVMAGGRRLDRGRVGAVLRLGDRCGAGGGAPRSGSGGGSP